MRAEAPGVNPTDLTTQLDSMAYPPVGVTSESYTTVYTSSAGVTYEPGTARAASQRYLRNRVSSTASTRAGASATYYSYDPHGNVEWIVQDIQGLGQNYIRYEYDLVSNKVVGLYYNEGLGEHLSQRYSYDEDNRVVKVESSRNGVIWDRDASYTYYLHGPVRRAEYGEDSIQGVDYTHTLEGWLKGINHQSLLTSVDPGLDGDATAGVHPKYAADAFGMALTYYAGDFLRKSGTSNSAFNSSSPTGYSMRGDHLPGDSDLVRAGHLNLYNGNIAAWSSNAKNVPGGLSGEQYAYDRLNRLLSSTFTTYNGTSSVYMGNGDYNTSYTYDPSGNILTLNRNQDTASGQQQMDILTYWYPATQNRLLYVDDKVAVGNPNNDIDDQAPGNYAYDASGRLIYDRQEGINAIDWSPTNKPLAVRKAGTIIRFFYDAQGNRIKKESGGTTTYYVYEAGGKLLATYTQPCVRGADMAGGGDEGCLSASGLLDTDHDGTPDSVDNAPLFFNPDQHDGDGDGVGDPIDTDDDNDGISDFTDPCPFDPLNSCVGDVDSDGIPDAIDGCANTPGNGGGDKDGDGKPDGCDQDLDGDGVPNHEDNCPWTYNPDQADADTNGIGDVCQCPAETTGGTCPITLAEQFVYGSELDGRVVTVFRDTLRDVSDHSVSDSIFTRRLRQKEYELNDHLGNVRVRVSDLKRTSTPGSAPYTVDERGYQEYYPFGMLEPNRGATLQGLTPRFGYNGKEMDNDVNNRNGAAGQNGGGNSYDYGARMYNPRLGRFLSEDPLAPEYAWYTPYQFAGNTPIMAIDLDGQEPKIVISTEVSGYTFQRLTGAYAEGGDQFIVVKTYYAYLVDNKKPNIKLAKFNVTRDAWYSRGALDWDANPRRYEIVNRHFEPADGNKNLYTGDPIEYPEESGLPAFRLTQFGKRDLMAEPFTREQNTYLDGMPIDDGRKNLAVARDVMFHIGGYFQEASDDRHVAASYGCFGYVPPTQVFKSIESVLDVIHSNSIASGGTSNSPFKKLVNMITNLREKYRGTSDYKVLVTVEKRKNVKEKDVYRGKNARKILLIVAFCVGGLGLNARNVDSTGIGYRETGLHIGDNFSKVSRALGGLTADPNGAHRNSQTKHDYVTFVTGVNGDSVNATIACSFEGGRLFYFSISYLFITLRVAPTFLEAKRIIGNEELADLNKAKSVWKFTENGIRREITFDPKAVMPYLRFKIEKMY